MLSLDYRLAPEHQFPAAVEDSVAAIEWLSHEASALGLDAERIAIAGDSAGGGLAAVALHETKGRLAAPVRAQVLIYPALDIRGRLPSRKDVAHHFPIPRDMIQWFFSQYFGLAWPIADPRAIPALYEDYTGLPPALIVTAGHDPLRDEGAEYAQTLAAAGVPVDYECVGKAWECFWTVSLDKGQITVEGPFYDKGDSVLAITGGTGDYADAEGEMALSAIGTDGKAYGFIYKLK